MLNFVNSLTIFVKTFQISWAINHECRATIAATEISNCGVIKKLRIQ
jgi:hypothetical protein